MLPVSQLPVDIKGLTPEMKTELEERILEFEKDYEPVTSKGGEGYVPKIQKSDYWIAGIINGIITIYFIIAMAL